MNQFLDIPMDALMEWTWPILAVAVGGIAALLIIRAMRGRPRSTGEVYESKSPDDFPGWEKQK